MKITPRHAVVVGSAVLVGLVGLGTAAAFASGSDADADALFGCVHQDTGVLHVIDPERGDTCGPREYPITWNVGAGPAGPGGVPRARRVRQATAFRASTTWPACHATRTPTTRARS